MNNSLNGAFDNERSKFESLPQIKGILIGGDFYFSTLSMNYKSKKSDHLHCVYFLNGAWYAWQEKAKTQSVPEGYVLVTEDQAKDTARLDFMLDDSTKRTICKQKHWSDGGDLIKEGQCVAEIYYISGWDYMYESISDTKRQAIDKAMFENESGAVG